VSRPPVGANLDAELRRVGWTNEHAAARSGVSERQIRRWRNGETAPTWGQVVKLAVAFGREPSWFYAVHEDPSAAGGDSAA
jgi:transcriptional regulator with XRE-family HTH domain